MALSTSYVDDVLDTSKSQLRKYNMIQNDDGTVSFIDATTYTTEGTSFGASDINATNTQVNTNTKAIHDKATINHASTSTTYGAGTTSKYGHCKTVNDLTTSSYVDGEALSAYQGAVLNKSLATTNSTVSSLSTTVSKKQDASTAITTSNISSQSVRYAEEALVSQYGMSSKGASAYNIYVNGSTANLRFHIGDDAAYSYSNAGLGVQAIGGSGNGWKPVYASSFVQSSSRDFKENIEELTEDEAKKLLQLKPSTFDFKEEYGGKKGCYGLIAEEVEEVIPSVVTSMLGEKKGVDYVGFIPFLIKMVQMQEQRIADLEAKLSE